MDTYAVNEKIWSCVHEEQLMYLCMASFFELDDHFPLPIECFRKTRGDVPFSCRLYSLYIKATSWPLKFDWYVMPADSFCFALPSWPMTGKYPGVMIPLLSPWLSRIIFRFNSFALFQKSSVIGVMIRIISSTFSVEELTPARIISFIGHLPRDTTGLIWWCSLIPVSNMTTSWIFLNYHHILLTMLSYWT